jgi:hypothetical protein
MKKSDRLLACAAFVAVATCIPALSSAQSPFDGTWHSNLSQAKFSPKPNVFYLSQGFYHCVSCVPTFDVKADGTDQPVAGQAYDTISVKEVDPKTISVTAKKGSTAEFDQIRSVSADGKTLTVKTTGHPAGGGSDVVTESTATLVGVAPSGVHATSGSWKIVKVKQSDNGVTTTYKTTGDQITMSDPTGETYTAKLDGTDAPVKGAYTFNTVSVKKIDAHTLEETDKRDATVVAVVKMTVSADGKKMTVVYTNKLTDRVNTYIDEKK